MDIRARTGRRLPGVLGSLLAVLIATSVVSAPTALADPPAPPRTPTAHSIHGVSTVGPVFRSGLTIPHACTGSVVDALSRNLVLTAAHCLSGTAAGWLFVPGYEAGHTPYGVWTVTHAYVDPAWIAHQDPQHDYALLQVADQSRDGRRRHLEDVTGGNVLGIAPWPGRPITDIAYNAGINDAPIRCAAPTYGTAGYPSINCHGFVGGSSGSPWLVPMPGTARHFVVGVIGGLHQGGLLRVHLVLLGVRPGHLPAVVARHLRCRTGHRPQGRRRRLLTRRNAAIRGQPGPGTRPPAAGLAP